VVDHMTDKGGGRKDPLSRPFKGIHVPKSVWLYPTFGAAEKCLYGDILSYTPTGSTKDIREYADEFVLSRAAVKRAIAALLSAGFIGKRKVGKYIEYYAVEVRGGDIGGELVSITESRDSSSSSSSSIAIDKVIEIAYPWAEQEFADTWAMWNEERKDRKLRKYTRRGEQAALHKLFNESGGSMSVAIQMIHQSVANGWQGIFPLKNNGKRKGFDKSAIRGDELRNYLESLGDGQS
jgi:hypothetical protein